MIDRGRRAVARPRLGVRLRAALTLLACLPLAAWAADPQITAFTDTDPVPAGGIVQYDLRVDNNQADAAQNTQLRVTVPSGATFISAGPAGANCSQASATEVLCNLGSVGGGGADPRDITLRWRALGPGPTTVNATAVVTADNDVNPGNNTQTATTSVITGANLALAKTGAPNPVVGGATIGYTLTASNAGPNDSGDIVVTDNLPPSVSYVSATGSGWTCSHAAGVVTCTRSGPHAVGATIPAITLVGRVNAPGGTVTNSATVAPATFGGVADPDSSNNTATFDASVLPGADLSVGKSVGSALPAVGGSNVSFLLQPRNAGPATASSVTVTDTLPAGWTFVSVTSAAYTCGNSGNTVTCTRASLTTSATDDITLVARAPASGTHTNTATVGAATADPNGANNNGSVTVAVLPDGADLGITKSKSPNPVAQGSNLTSTITVTNNGPRTATGPLRVIELLSGETFVGVGGSGWTCDASGAPTIVCNHPNTGGLAVNAALPTLTLTTRADNTGSLINTACTGSSVPLAAGGSAQPPAEGDATPGNDCATASATSTAVQPDLGITKTTSTPSGGDKIVSTAEGTVTYTLVVANVSATPQAATGLRIYDDVPAFIAGRTTFGSITATPSGGSTATFSCATAGSLVQCDQTGGQLLQGQSVTVSITVNRPLRDGTFTNNASIQNVNEGDPNPNNNQASDTVTIEPIADVEMTGKSVTPGSVRAGEVATYVLSYRNNGPSAAAGVTVSDTFTFPGGDSGVTVVQLGSSAPGSTCNIAAGALLTPASPAFSCNIGTLTDGQTESITLRVRPNFQPGNGARTFTNLARVNTTSVENPAGGDNGNNEQTATLNVTAAQVDLLVNKTDRVGALNLDPVPFVSGSTFLGYQVSVTNNGPSYATGVRISELMTPPAGRRVRFVCDVTGFGSSTCNPVPLCSVSNVTSASGTALPAFTCNVPAGDASSGAAVGEMAVGATKNIWLRFEALDQPAPRGDVFTDVATALANEPDSQPANDSESEQTTVRQRVDLRTTKTASVTNPALRQPFNWLIRVINNGPGNSLQTDLTDNLPAGVEVTGPITWTRTQQPASGSCTLTGSSVACALGQLDAGGAADITVPVRIVSYPAGGTLSNSATVDTDPDKTGGIDTPGGNNTGSSTITVLRSSISGTVFQDRDRAGANGGVPQAPGSEPRIAGVTVTLSGTDAYGNAVNLSATTDSNGNYSFGDLSPSNGSGYTVTEAQPAGFVNGPVAPPASGGSAPSAGGTYAAGGSAGNSSYGAVVLAAGVTAANYNFPEVAVGSLAGFVYVDLNANGTRNPGTDLPIAGATVRLLNASTGAEVAVVSTGADGSYAFTALDPFTAYTLEQPLPATPAGLRNGPVNPGLVNGAACASGCTAQPDTPAAGSDRIASIDLSTGAAGTAFNFGEVLTVPITGTVYIDRDRNGTLGAGDGGLAGVTVRLVQGSTCGGTVVATTTTDANGNYAFGGVQAGLSYTICEAQPVAYGDGSTTPGSGGTSTVANAITLTSLAPGGSSGNHFGEQAATLSGTVFLDGNSDGQQQGGETGIAGVTINLSGTDAAGNPVTRSTITGVGGQFSFADLPAAGPGGYTLTEPTQPPGTGNGITTAGSSGGSATPVGTLPSAISAIPLAAGATSINHLFAEVVASASLAGRVWLDTNNNGLIDGSEAGITGVTVELSGTDAGGATITRSTSTGADGSYRFDSLPPGTYAVREPVQPAGTLNGRTVAGSTGGTATPAATTPSAVSAIVLANGVASTQNNFGELPPASIGGQVFADNDDDGQPGSGEQGLSGVTIVLSGTDDLGNPVTLTTTTAADGSYSFGNLRPGTYTLTEPTQPAGTVNGRTAAGPLGGNASGPGVAPSTIAAIVLTPGAQAGGNLFAEVAQSPDLRASKQLVGSVFTVGIPARYAISVRNAGELPTSGSYTVSDRLPTGLTLAATPSGSGWTCSGAVGASSFSCTSGIVIAAGNAAAGTIDLPVNVAAAAAAASPVNNAVLVEGGGEIPARGPGAAERAAFDGNVSALPVCTATVTQNACRAPTPVQLAASIAGTVWADTGTASHLLDAGDRRLAGWQVEALDASGAIVGRATTGSDGRYRVDTLQPGIPLTVRFRDPASGIVFGYPVNGETAPGSSGAACEANPGTNASSCVGSGANPALTVVLKPGENLPQQSLPVDPSGVVYDSGTRQPVPGSIVTLAPTGACTGWNPATSLVAGGLGGYTVSGSAVSMTVGADGFYQFLFAPAAPASCNFGLTVTPPAGYGAPSTAMPPTAGPLVPTGGPGSTYPVQPQAAPPSAPPGSGTAYYLVFTGGSAGANIIHNHIPLDPALPSSIALAKTGDRAAAEVGDSVRYTITVSVGPGAALPRQTTVVDRLPAGFTYIRGTAMLGDVPLPDPQGGVGPMLAFNLGPMPASRQLVLHYRVRIGVGAQQGDGINRARGHACGAPGGCVSAAFEPLPGSVATNESAHRVRVGGGVFTTEACVLGKVFVDCNGNHVQDAEELGIPGVRLFMQDGTTLISDSEGKYSVCGVPPRSAVLKVDPVTLPRGSRLTTSSNRNLGDAGSLWLDIKNGELHRADFIEGSCSNPVLDQVKARRAQGEVRAPEREREKGPALRFDSKAHGLTPATTPQQGTESANQQQPKPRATGTEGGRDGAR